MKPMIGSAGGAPDVAPPPGNRRVLIVDDNLAIHDDFRKILSGGSGPRRNLLEVEAALFGGGPVVARPSQFELDSAHQGQEALEKVKLSLAAGKPYAMAFIDMRMPPGWDGLETIVHLWEVDPELQVVICTAYSDYSWEEMSARLGETNSLVVLKKPFDNIEVLQLAHAFTRKWDLNRQANLKMDELSQMVAQRTRELQEANREIQRESEERLQLERQFRQAQKMEAIGQLAAGVAHDFNNILTVIHGHASMLAMKLGQQGTHTKSISEIRNSAERAANLVRQLLTFSRKQIMQFRNVDVGEVVISVSAMLRDLVGEHISLETECAVGLPPIHADRGMIEQVILNLAVNARDAMERGGRLVISTSRVEVSMDMAKDHPDARPGSFVRLTVSDTGCGIPPETMGRLFEPFFTTKEVGKGTGLGLATVFGIVKQHQAWIQVESKVGAGSTFRVFFPVSGGTSSRLSEEGETPGSHLGTETILIAEDEAPLREMVSDILNLHGYKVIRANSGPAALAICQIDQPKIDLLLTDMVMPGGMMGTDLAAELQRTNPDLKIIYTTGYSPGSTGLKDALHPGVEFLPKPYSPHKLAELVRKTLDRKPTA
jgi:signal transduction histidine kinase